MDKSERGGVKHRGEDGVKENPVEKEECPSLKRTSGLGRSLGNFHMKSFQHAVHYHSLLRVL